MRRVCCSPFLTTMLTLAREFRQMIEFAVIFGKREIGYGAVEEVKCGFKDQPGTIYEGSRGSAMDTIGPYGMFAIGVFLLCYALIHITLEYNGFY